MGKMNDFAGIITRWYGKNKRPLPWRQTTDPYRIWLSEIILQQTRIEQGMSYYLNFVKTYPTVFDFANAPEDDILKMWQGLGYYSRARNMHFTAKLVSTKYNGKFPANYNELLLLKGIGEYTAAAIASIAFNLPHPSIDGNVYRVLSRVYGVSDPIDTNSGKKVFRQLAAELMDEKQPGTFNQAVMEFGALHCKPQNPKCDDCPFSEKCYAYINNRIKTLPVKNGKTKVTNRYFNYIILKSNGYTFIHKRTGNDIWKNLFQFPLIETTAQTDLDALIPQLEKITGNAALTIESESAWKKHILSHQRIHYRFISLQIDEEKNIATDLIKVNKKDIFKFAVPKLIESELHSNNWF